MYKIYKIVDNTNGNVYIGQTKQKYLSNRISCHKQDFKRGHYVSSQIILKNNDWFYEKIEDTEDITREKYWVQNTPNCINKNIKFGEERTYEERKPYFKQNYQDNKLRKNERMKKYNKFRKTWGGDPRSSNNLLNIDINLFNYDCGKIPG